MSHNTAGLAPYITASTTLLNSAGAGKILSITGYGLGLGSTVDIPVALAAETGRSYTQGSGLLGTLSITVTVAALPDPAEDKTVAVSNGGVPCQGVGVTAGAITVQHGGFHPLDRVASLWLDASDASTVTLNGSNVSGWDNKATGVYAGMWDLSQSTAANQPTYALASQNGLNSVRVALESDAAYEDFLSGEGDATYHSVANTSTGAFTAFFCMTSTNSGSQPRFFGINRTGSGPWYLGTYESFFYGDNASKGFGWINDPNNETVNANDTYNIDTTARVYTYRNQASDPLRYGGANIATADNDAPFTTTYTAGHTSAPWIILGQYDYRSGWAFAGDFFEVIIYPELLTDGQCADVEAYLATKWIP